MLTPTKCPGTSPPLTSAGSTRTVAAASGRLFTASSDDAPAATTGTAAVTDAMIANALAERLARRDISRPPRGLGDRPRGDQHRAFSHHAHRAYTLFSGAQVADFSR